MYLSYNERFRQLLNVWDYIYFVGLINKKKKILNKCKVDNKMIDNMKMYNVLCGITKDIRQLKRMVELVERQQPIGA